MPIAALFRQSRRGSPSRRRRRSPRGQARRPLPRAPKVPLAPPDAARAAGLRYICDDTPGIRRVKRGKGFAFLAPSGAVVRDRDTLARIRSLAIPPAWTDVWIAPTTDAHLQATGRDARGRKQYRYHPLWRAHRDETKYTRMIAFAMALPSIRARVEQDLRDTRLSKRRVVAAIVQLLEKTFIRIGNEEYARTNGSFGLTTLLDEHVEVEGPALRFEFNGKSGVRHAVTLRDPRLARVVKRCQDLPGQTLFQYVTDTGERQSVGSAEINDYLREASGADFTAKDFRTWAGTVLAAVALRHAEPAPSRRQAKRTIVRAVERVADRLGNTVAVCRKCYIHPAILDAYTVGTLFETVEPAARFEVASAGPELSDEESAVLALLQRNLAKDAREPARHAS